MIHEDERSLRLADLLMRVLDLQDGSNLIHKGVNSVSPTSVVEGNTSISFNSSVIIYYV